MVAGDVERCALSFRTVNNEPLSLRCTYADVLFFIVGIWRLMMTVPLAAGKISAWRPHKRFIGSLRPHFYLSRAAAKRTDGWAHVSILNGSGNIFFSRASINDRNAQQTASVSSQK